MANFTHGLKTFLTLIVLFVLVICYQSYSFAEDTNPSGSGLKRYTLFAQHSLLGLGPTHILTFDLPNIFPFDELLNKGNSIADLDSTLSVKYETSPSTLRLIGRRATIAVKNSIRSAVGNRVVESVPAQVSILNVKEVEQKDLGDLKRTISALISMGVSNVDSSTGSMPTTADLMTEFDDVSAVPGQGTTRVTTLTVGGHILLNQKYVPIEKIKITSRYSGQVWLSVYSPDGEQVLREVMVGSVRLNSSAAGRDANQLAGCVQFIEN
jgi:hypothetical protein